MRKRQGILNREAILELLASPEPLLEGLTSPDLQVQPAGVDLTLRSIHRFQSAGSIGADNADRRLPALDELLFGPEGYVDLPAGAYHIVYNEIVRVPRDVLALGLPRSSLLRCGVTIHTAVWEPGYYGRGVSPLVVHNPFGFRVQRGARIFQLVFIALSGVTREGYSGIFQRENVHLEED